VSVLGFRADAVERYLFQTVRRLYSTFAQGGPGIGLLLLRLAAGVTAVVQGLAMIRNGGALGSELFDGLHIGLGLLLVIGLWTPLAATALAAIALADAYLQPDVRWFFIIDATLSAALVLIGPGMWSVDARLFGWRRLEIPKRSDSGPSP
jgi:putative oxidoreductase